MVVFVTPHDIHFQDRNRELGRQSKFFDGCGCRIFNPFFRKLGF